MKKKFKMLISVLLLFVMCSSVVSAAPGADTCITADGLSGIKISDTSADYVIPEDLKESSSIIQAEDSMPRNQIGEPMDQMYFYYMYLYPIVGNPETGDVKVLNTPLAGGAYQTRQYFSVEYTPAETVQMYQKVIEQGYDMLGWQAKIKFRFDFITPVSWVRMQNYQNPVEENVTQPHNAYQTYIYTFNSYFQTNPLEQYSVSLSGTVHHFDKYDKKTEDVPFNASVYFNMK